MKERPILFSSMMVKALLDGTKTQTRRVIKPQPTFLSGGWHWAHKSYNNGDGAHYFHTTEECAKRLLLNAGIAPKIGERRWVKETFMRDPVREGKFYYAASLNAPSGKWKPSIFMPKLASRITLEIVSVRAERLQNISEQDAKAEGVDPVDGGRWKNYNGPSSFESAKASYFSLWDSINKKRGLGFDSNPWCWVIGFQCITPAIDNPASGS